MVYGDYGYMEEGKLGKPYNIKLIKKLLIFAIPYRAIILFSLILTMIITGVDLSFPYISKIAIDRYILNSWFMINPDKKQDPIYKKFIQEHKKLLINSSSPDAMFIARSNLKKIDPSLLNQMKKNRVILDGPWYKMKQDKSEAESNKQIKMIPSSKLISFNKNHILRIRADDLKGLELVALVLLILICISFFTGYGEHYFLEWIGQNIMQDIRLELFRRIQDQGISFFDRNPVGRLLTRVTNDIENLNEMFKSVLITIFKDIFILAGIMAVMLYLDLRLALISFTIIPIIILVTSFFSRIAREVFRNLRQMISRMNTFLQDRISGIRLIKALSVESEQMKLFSEINHQIYVFGMKQIKVFGIFMPLMELLSSIALGILIWFGGGSAIRNQISLGTLVAFIGYIQMFFKPIRDISEKYNIMQSAMASTERIFEYMDMERQVKSPGQMKKSYKLKGHIVFDNVSFGYSQNSLAVKDISFEVKPGDTIALVGATGAGKTTIFNLLMKFYEPQKGHIYIDGIELREIPADILRENIAIAMQDIFLFKGTLRENITLGRDDISPSQMELAIRDSNLSVFIKRLSKGLDHMIGEGGIKISSGERQLLSIARALILDPQVLLLDEATSRIDPETERMIQDAIARAAGKRTTLIIAHRPSTIKQANRIIVLHKGRIKETGSHEELISMGGIYSRLISLYSKG